MSKRSVQVPLDQERSQAKRARAAAAGAMTTDEPRKGAVANDGASSSRRGAKAIFALEDRQADGHATRKSTRGSVHRVKAGTALQARQELRMSAPSQRNARGK